jgi:hypothetical protein
MLPTGLTLHDMTVTEETYPGSTPRQAIKVVELVGTRQPTDTKLSPAICGLLHFGTATPKRYARGRIFCPGAYSSTSTQSGGTWDPGGAYMVNVNNFGAAYAAAFSTGDTDYAPEVFSRTQVQKGLPDFAFPITSVSLRPTMYFLRSRLTSP